MGFIDFTTGQVLTADQMDLVMRQSVMRFADAATRDTALTGVLAEGMICYLDDTNEVLKYDGTDWVAIDPETITAQGDIIVGDAGGDASRLALGTAGQILESDGTALSYVTPDSSPDDIITTEGDLIIGDASGDAVRLPVGAADTVLTSDGTTVSFAAAGGGGGGITLLGTIDITGVSEAVFSSISQDYQDLILIAKDYGSTNNRKTLIEFSDGADQLDDHYTVVLGGFSPIDRNELRTFENLSSDTESSAVCRIYDYTSSSTHPITATFAIKLTNGLYKPEMIFGSTYEKQKIDKIRFADSSANNFSGGTVELYGVK